MRPFNFGPSFIRWVSTLYKNISSCVLNNGFATALFQVQRGVRQGDPLSPYLFNIVIELLAISIRSDRGIEGIKVDNEEVKVELFADDLTAFLRNDHSLRKFLDKTEDFGVCSALYALIMTKRRFYSWVTPLRYLNIMTNLGKLK